MQIVEEEERLSGLLKELSSIPDVSKIPKDDAMNMKQISLAEKLKQTQRLKQLCYYIEERMNKLDVLIQHNSNELQNDKFGDEGNILIVRCTCYL
jgi:hypothetical protein